jgi:hypothetical protein
MGAPFAALLAGAGDSNGRESAVLVRMADMVLAAKPAPLDAVAPAPNEEVSIGDG